MKSLIAALVLSTVSVPVMAMDTAPVFTGASSSEVLFPMLDEFGRRSGLCPKYSSVAREGSTCGGV